MSGHDYVNRSTYTRGRGTQTYVTKIETYVADVHGPRVVGYEYSTSPTKIIESSKQATASYNHDLPPEVEDFFSKILTEVNGPSKRTSDPNYKSENPPRTSVIPSNYGVSSHQHGAPPSHAYDRGPQKNYDYPNNSWDRSSPPEYDHSPRRDYYDPEDRWRTMKNHGVPNNQWGSSPKSYELEYGVPKSHMSSPPKKSQAQQGYGDPKGPSYLKPDASSNGRAPNYQWGGSPIRSRTTGDYGAPKTQLSNYPVKSQTQQGYAAPNNLSSHQPETQKHHEAPRMDCKDGLCTLSDKPKVTSGPYDEPKGTSQQSANKFADYYDEAHKDNGSDGRRSDLYAHDYQPGGYKNNNWMKPNAYNNTQTSTPLGKVTDNKEKAISQLTAATKASPEGTIARSSTTPTAKRTGFLVPRIDNKEAARRYGGVNIPPSANSSGREENRVITSKELLEKYNGISVPK